MKFNVSKEDRYKTGVYQITNLINGKIYIGSASRHFYIRYHQHISDYKARKHGVRKLCYAFDKYGIENFEFKIKHICEKTDCLKWEQFYIDKGTDYNCAKIAGSLLNHKHPSTSKTRTIRGGKHHSAKPVYQFSIYGVLLKKYGSISDAIIELKKPKGSLTHISECCKGKVFSIFGYRWSFEPKLIDRYDKRCLRGQKILVKKGAVEKIFKNQVEATNYLKTLGYKASQGTVSRAIRLKIKMYKHTIIRLT